MWGVRMKRNVDLLNGKILPALTALAMPIMATSLVQMAYNLTDMFWVGQLGSHAVTAVGSAGMYMWLSSGIVAAARAGGQIRTAHAIGQGNPAKAGMYAAGALQLALFLALVFALVTNLFPVRLIRLFGLETESIIQQGALYLRITGGLIAFSFLNQTLAALYTSAGNSKTPFFANLIGMGMNIVLDPLLILGVGPFPVMGTAGAAIATVFAQMLVFFVLVLGLKKDRVLFCHMKAQRIVPLSCIKEIVQMGFPASVQNIIYTSISMVLTRFVTAWGDDAVGVLRLGSQIESISWTTAEGFGTAMNAFTGQNYGGGKYKRVKKGYYTASAIVLIWGMITSCLLVFGGGFIYGLFVREPEVVLLGGDYLRILGYGQLFMCMELMTIGALSGLGKTFQCSVISIALTTVRIPLALVLGNWLGLNGIWWAFTLSSMAKGVCFFGYYLWQSEKRC